MSSGQGNTPTYTTVDCGLLPGHAVESIDKAMEGVRANAPLFVNLFRQDNGWRLNAIIQTDPGDETKFASDVQSAYGQGQRSQRT